MIPEALGNTDIFIVTIKDRIEKRITQTLNVDEGPSDWAMEKNLLFANVAGSSTDSSGNLVLLVR